MLSTHVDDKTRSGLLACLLRWRQWLIVVSVLAAGTVDAASEQELLDELPATLASALSAGDVDNLLKLYAADAFVHVVLTNDELSGHQQIRDYYIRHYTPPPRVMVTEVVESKIIAVIGLLSGDGIIEFPDQPPIPIHFSIVAKLENNGWLIQLLHTSRIVR
jgi:hypothetical protein